MFHRPAGLPTMGSSSHGGMGTTVVINHHQNENLIIHPHKNSNNNNNPHKDGLGSDGGGGGVNKDSSNISISDAKTPANKETSIRRRALGDISNKKQTRTSVSGIVGGGGGTGGFTIQKDVLKSTRTSIVPSTSSSYTSKKSTTSRRDQITVGLSPRKATQALLIPRLSNDSNYDASHTSTILKSSASRSVRPPLSVIKDDDIPTKLKDVSKENPVAGSTTVRRPIVRIEEPVPDIELPAGRTWRQQLEHDLLDEDDIASTSSIDSFHPKDRTMWDDWGESLWLRHKAQERKGSDEEAKEADRLVREQIEKLMDREAEEEQRGLEALYDVIDNLDFLGDEKNLLELDWSVPASSRCGDDEDDNLLNNKLLFEL